MICCKGAVLVDMKNSDLSALIERKHFSDDLLKLKVK
jgi:hypothetical protein